MILSDMVDLLQDSPNFEELALRLQQQKAVASFGLLALSEIAPEQLMEEAVKLVSKILEVPYASVYRYVHETNVLHCGASTIQPADKVRSQILPQPDSMAGYTFIQKAPVILEEKSTETRFQIMHLSPEFPVQSGLAVPLLGKTAQGVLIAVTDQSRLFTKTDIDFMQSIANVLAMAIEKKQAETDLQESKQKYQEILENAYDGIWTWDIRTNEVFWNDRLYEMHGLTKDTFKPTLETFTELIHPEDREKVSAAITTHLEKNTKYELEIRQKHTSGGYRHFFARGAAIRDESGRPIRMVGATIDITDKKQAELALVESEERFRTMADAAHTLIWMTDENNNLVYLNKSFLQYVGLPEDGSSLNPWQSYPPEDELVLIQQAMQNSAETGVPFRMEHRLRRPDGSWGWLIATGAPRYTKDGVFKGFIGANMDVTEDKKTQAALKESEAQLRAILDATPECVKIVDPDGTVKYMNTGGLNMVEADSSDTVNNACVFDIIAPEYRQAWIENHHRVCKGEIRSWEYDIVGLRGTRRRMETHAVPLPNPDGTFSHLAVTRDVTARKAAEEGILKAYEREHTLRRIVEISSQSFDIDYILNATAIELGRHYQVDRCVLIRFTENRNTFLPDKPCQYLASADIPLLKVEDMPFRTIPIIGRKHHDEHPTVFARYSDLELYLEQIDAALGDSSLKPEILAEFRNYAEKSKTKSSLGLEIQYRGQSYGAILLHHCRHTREWQEEEVTLLEHIATNIGAALYQAELFRQEQKAREQAETANRKKSDFLAMMSHELRTPLNAILGYSQMMKNGMAGAVTSKQSGYLDHIGTSGSHLLEIINDLLDVSRIEAGKLTISTIPLDLGPVIADVRSLMQPLAARKEVMLYFDIDSNIGYLEADPTRLKQIFVNLVSNAIKFNRPHGKVVVQVSKADDWARIAVSDTGLGIPRHKLPELFQKFYQVDTSPSRPHEGTGLGLVLTKHLVELHGGQISVESEEGQGSTFVFTIPLFNQP